MHKEIKEFIVNTLIMAAIALVAGGILGFVYEKTKEPIAISAQKEKEAANKKVFSDAEKFSEPLPCDEALYASLKEKYPGVDITSSIEAQAMDGSVLGYVCEVVAHEGYGGDIVFYAGIKLDGTLNGISITSISETAGLGMKAPEVLVPQFTNRVAEFFEVTKTGATEDNQIDAISSVTVTSKAVTNGVNAALEYFRTILTGGVGNES